MDGEEARRLLGVGEGAPADEVRSAFRRLLLRHHPDVRADGAATTRAITDAYRVLQAGPEPPPTVPAATTTEATTSGDTIEVALPPDEAFFRLAEAGSAIGEVTYVDAETGLLEVIVTFDDGRTASLVITLQGRATGTTEAFCTLESLGHRPPPPTGVVLDALVRTMGAPPIGTTGK